MNDLITQIEAFDENGFHIGWAVLGTEGWSCVCHKTPAVVLDEHQARQWLRDHGAAKLKERYAGTHS